MHQLFSYGTLQLPQVQLQTFGRLLHGTQDTLLGYVLGELKITDPEVVKTSGKEVHPILRYTGDAKDRVEGTIFTLSEAELTQSDSYEVAQYTRVLGQFVSTQQAWVYVCAETESRRLKG
ncbi:gamma-glutamylcyclotransferase family protein [Pseudoalteromonas pernae]|uniref:gamma-glutamylcyclotransferase family protein n=1 Tax=Pseudoalteromonas pernae TaxID=3118054 RepID=UPI003242EE3E